MDPAVELKNVSFQYKNCKTFALKNINFSLGWGECAVIMGSSASGKTTLCQCLNGLIPQAVEGNLKGYIQVAGKDVSRFRVQTLAKDIGFVMQDPEVQIVGRTVYEDLVFGPRNFLVSKDEINERIRRSLSFVGLEGYEKRFTTALSGGEKQRLTIAGVLAMNPQIIVLDEPAAELDPSGRNELYRHLADLRKKTGASMVIVEQKIDDICEIIDTVLLLKKGQIQWQKSPKEVSILNDFSNKPFSQARSMQNSLPKTTAENCLAALEVKNLNFSFSLSEPVLKDINLNIYPNDFLAIVGPNGAGKTSLVKHLNGLIPIRSGSISLHGNDIRSIASKDLSQSIGFVFQNPDHQIFENSVEKEIGFGLSNKGMSKNDIQKRIDETIDYIGLNKYRNHHPFTLGKGIRQMVAVASIVALKPEILVVDEPTTGLDSKGIQKIMDIIEKLYKDGTAIVLISHDMKLVQKYSRRLLVLNKGRIILNETTKTAFSEKKDILKNAGLFPVYLNGAKTLR